MVTKGNDQQEHILNLRILNIGVFDTRISRLPTQSRLLLRPPPLLVLTLMDDPVDADLDRPREGALVVLGTPRGVGT